MILIKLMILKSKCGSERLLRTIAPFGSRGPFGSAVTESFRQAQCIAFGSAQEPRSRSAQGVEVPMESRCSNAPSKKTLLTNKTTSERNRTSCRTGSRVDGADRIRKSASGFERICCDFTFSLNATETPCSKVVRRLFCFFFSCRKKKRRNTAGAHRIPRLFNSTFYLR
jgi:hypothetical protein